MLKNLKLEKKLFLTFILVAVMLSVGSIFNLSMMSNMNRRYGDALNRYGFTQGDIGIFSTELNNSSSIMREIISYSNSSEIQAGLAQYESHMSNVDKYLEKMGTELSGDAEKKLYDSVKNDYAEYKENSASVIEQAKEDNDEMAINLLNGQCVPLMDRINSSVLELIHLKTQTGTQIQNQLNVQNRGVIFAILDIMVIAIGLSLFIARAISRGISKPVKQMANAAQEMANGNLKVQIDVKSTDEIGELGTSLRQTIESLSSYIEEIKVNLAKVAQGDLNIRSQTDFKGDFIELRDSILQIVDSFNDALVLIDQASKQITIGSSQVSSSAQALAQGASEQASTVEELTVAIDKISSDIRTSAEHAVNVGQNVSLVREEIEKSNQLMCEMTEAMNSISESSEQIKQIIKTIDDIAFQTNILALNAAVEAARAGAAGKGFSVVADEVRNLAGKSAQAAKETTELIENSSRQVENGNRLADATARAMLSVMERARSTTETVAKISKLTKEQSHAITQVTQGVEQISNVVQTNSATAEENAAASEELAGQARSLQELLKRFRLRKLDESNQPSDESEEPNTENAVYEAAELSEGFTAAPELLPQTAVNMKY